MISSAGAARAGDAPPQPLQVEVDVYAATQEEQEEALGALAQISDPSFGAAPSRALAVFGRPPLPDLGLRSFSAPLFFSVLPASSSIGRVVLHSARTTSTQSLVQQLGRQLPEGCVALADVQVSGRGRGGNVWTSPEGCLMVTMLKTLRGMHGDRVAFAQYAVSVAICRAVERAVRMTLNAANRQPRADKKGGGERGGAKEQGGGGDAGGAIEKGGGAGAGGAIEKGGGAGAGVLPAPGSGASSLLGGTKSDSAPGASYPLVSLPLRIKWPNDIYLDGLKLVGVLCNSAFSAGAFRMSIGFGLNLDNDEPTISVNGALRQAILEAQIQGLHCNAEEEHEGPERAAHSSDDVGAAAPAGPRPGETKRGRAPGLRAQAPSPPHPSFRPLQSSLEGGRPASAATASEALEARLARAMGGGGGGGWALEDHEVRGGGGGGWDAAQDAIPPSTAADTPATCPPATSPPATSVPAASAPVALPPSAPSPSCPPSSFPRVSRELLLALLCAEIDDALGTLKEHGFAPLASEYQSRWLHSGQRLTVGEEGAGPAAPGASVVVVGLSERGYLLAVDALSGEPYELHPDGNSLDFFKGLVRKKAGTS